MGKKAKSTKGALRAKERKLDKSTLPPPPKAVSDEVGSAKLLNEPSLPGSGYKALNQDGYDDGGVADLTLVIDLDDSVLRRKRGETDYFTALKADLLPRVMNGPLANLPRREQKIKLAKLLFSDEENDEDKTPSEVWTDSVDPLDDDDDFETKKSRKDRLASARMALSLSSVLREPACASLSLSEISKRRLACFGKVGGEDALRCANKAIEIASNGFWDRDDVEIEAHENPKIDPDQEKNATAPGLSHEESLKLRPIRVAELCLRSAYLHKGNALAALGREDEARETYLKVMPMLEPEPRCGRLDWERVSILVNIGNTYSRQGNYEKSNEQYAAAEALGREHIGAHEGNQIDGMGIVVVSMRARAFALKKDGREDEGKSVLKDVIETQIQLNAENEKKKAEQKDAAQEAASAK
jgi:tetratricopeptide (TPR) repeat protein